MKKIERITTEILEMSKVDRAMRTKARQDGGWDAGVDNRNTARLKEVVAENGWPTISVFGQKVSYETWLLTQHADHDPNFQAKCLELMKQLPKDEVSQENIAFLEDRIRVDAGKPQLYGTQFYGKGMTGTGPLPIEDEVNLDKRRGEMGLEPFAEYKAEMEKQ